MWALMSWMWFNFQWHCCIIYNFYKMMPRFIHLSLSLAGCHLKEAVSMQNSMNLTHLNACFCPPPAFSFSLSSLLYYVVAFKFHSSSSEFTTSSERGRCKCMLKIYEWNNRDAFHCHGNKIIKTSPNDDGDHLWTSFFLSLSLSWPLCIFMTISIIKVVITIYLQHLKFHFDCHRYGVQKGNYKAVLFTQNFIFRS